MICSEPGQQESLPKATTTKTYLSSRSDPSEATVEATLRRPNSSVMEENLENSSQ